MKFELWFPVKPFTVSQGFGDNLACVEQRTDIPVAQRKIVSGADNNTCPVGYEKLYPLLGLAKGHNGLDLVTFTANVYAAHDGEVCEISLEAGRGLGVGIRTKAPVSTPQGEFYMKTRYWHFKSIAPGLKLGDPVSVGTFIGVSDSTGLSSGDHVHCELIPQQKNVWGEQVNVFQTNGFGGKIDPKPFFNGYYAEDSKQVVSMLQAIIQSLSQAIAYYRGLRL